MMRPQKASRENQRVETNRRHAVVRILLLAVHISACNGGVAFARSSPLVEQLDFSIIHGYHYGLAGRDSCCRSSRFKRAEGLEMHTPVTVPDARINRGEFLTTGQVFECCLEPFAKRLSQDLLRDQEIGALDGDHVVVLVESRNWLEPLRFDTIVKLEPLTEQRQRGLRASA